MEEDLTIANIAVEVPARKYRLEFVLRRKPELEAPAEAILRALLTAERLGERPLRTYLGLRQEEFNVLIVELISKCYVHRSGPDLLLTTNGRKAIDPESEGQKREKRSVTLMFEDTAFAEVNSRYSNFWMRRMNASQVRADGRSEAISAFRQGFYSWRAREREGKPGDALSRVTNVIPLGRDTTVVSAPVTLAPASNAAYIEVSRIELGEITTSERREEFAERFRATVTGAHAPQDGVKALDWIEREISPIPGSAAADPVDWARRVKQGQISGGAHSILVAETAPNFISKTGIDIDFYSGLNRRGETSAEENIGRPDAVFWSPPEGESWSLDYSIDRAFEKLTRDLTYRNSSEVGGAIVGVLRLRQHEVRDAESTWGIRQGQEPFDATLLAASPKSGNNAFSPGVGEDFPQALEIILCPEKWVLALAHLSTERSPIPIPVGVATEDASVVSRVSSLFRKKVLEYREDDWRTKGKRNTKLIARLAETL
ncbi:hypothetical protein [Phaeobacter gallaeciensis]|uniref:hypothetical protein n=1 Tax=Phaeobacter gallaeciensis TaxID=60890 RepID=UPI00237F3348|nr:hypothetical protein [Phaeobacter gallaeciensis]MDE4061717.1 hypothetical protein [Phaeobacter gallaeciensis]MDE4124737.1 hypothetical protein [Phaeobacter gallaeciensis]MDE4129209.1 hypothetical protein [Phaeobacter gallaeciensis]